ncbi:hypothetical protein CEP53_015003 [Fusarium sp. AF-6]|nr:hypothetical protein CEP53_015003 [Fusarium sp. AF-6]
MSHLPDHPLPPEPQPSYAPDNNNNNASLTGRNDGPKVAEATPTAYSCPFRARNPLVFNPNDYETCAHSFSSISLVKSHNVKDFTTQCQKCRVWFTKKAFKAHQKNQGCFHWQPPAVDKYDKGITEAMATMLRERGAERRVLTWKKLCRTIFPDTPGNIVPNFERIVDLKEACEQFNQSTYMGFNLM